MPERPTLEAVLFDAGGTLVRLDFEWMSEALAEIGARVSAAALRRAEVEGRRRYDRRRGGAPGSAGTSGAPAAAGPDARSSAEAVAEPSGVPADVRAYFGGMFDAAGVPAPLVTPALERFGRRQVEHGLWTRPMEGARGALDDLGARGLHCAVVSNSDGRAEKHLADCDMLRGVEFVVDSHRVGIEKPDPRIFAIALERLGVNADRALFVGDIRSVDEVGARAAGTHFVLLDPLGDYAGDGVPAIPGMERLAEWVGGRFTIAPGRPARHTGDER